MYFEQVKTILANRKNYGGKRTQKVQFLVMHYTGVDGDSAESNANYFKQALNPVASAHYFVDDDSIVRSVPEEYVAYHCGAQVYYHPKCRNANSIGIELCDTRRNGVLAPTEQTLRNAAELVDSLMEKYDIPIENVIMHYDVTHKLCPAYWVKDRSGFERFKKMVKDGDYMTGEQIYKKLTEYLREQEAPEWAKEELAEAVELGITDGQRPCEFTPRYQTAIMTKRATKK